MSNLKRVWVKDNRDPEGKPFLHPEHLLQYSKNLEVTERPTMQRTVAEPAQTPDTERVSTARTTQRSNSGRKATTKKDKE